MSQNDGNGASFLAGAIVGGVVGGLLGTLLASQKEEDSTEKERSVLKQGTQPQFSTEESIEMARQSLEEKIAQLNLSIDDVREQLGRVNGNPQ